MTNYELIFREGRASGLITDEFAKQIEEFFEKTGLLLDLQLHTYADWKEKGYQVRAGERAKLKMQLWRFKGGKEKKPLEDCTEVEVKNYYYLKMSYLFTADQVKKVEVDK